MSDYHQENLQTYAHDFGCTVEEAEKHLLRMSTADEYIRKADAIDTVPKERTVEYMDEFGAGYNSCRNDILSSIESIKPADVAPVRHARWERYSGITIRCSRCEHVIHDWRLPECKYCPNCGAKMDGEREE